MAQADSGFDVSVGVLSQLGSYLGSRGLSLALILGSSGTDPRVLDDPDARIPAEAYMAAEEEAAALAGDPFLGLHMGEFHQPGNWSAAGHFMASCCTMGEVFEKGSRYARVIGNMISSKAWLVPGAIRVQLRVPRQSPPMSRHCWEAVLSSSVCMARRLSGTEVSPLAVRLTGEAPDDPSEYLRVFRCPVQFGCKAAGMDLPLSMAGLPVAAPDAESRERFAAWAQDILDRLPGLRLATRDASRAILERLDDPALSVRAVARSLGLSTRALQAALAAEGSDFSAILRSTRESLARRWLREGQTAEDIACLLGFSEASVFRRAFKQWTGLTPSQWRAGGIPFAAGPGRV